MIGAKITITPELAIRVGALAEHYKDASVEIAYDDQRDERYWQVTFDLGTETHRYIVDDKTGIAKADTAYYGGRACAVCGREDGTHGSMCTGPHVELRRHHERSHR